MNINMNIYDYNNVLIKTFNSSNMPKLGRDEYILTNILNNVYNDYNVVFIDNNTIQILTDDEYKQYGKDLKKQYKQEKKKKEINEIKKNNEIIVPDDPTNIKIVDYDDNILKTITQEFYNSTYLLYKPFIKKNYADMFDVKIDDNTIKIMNEEQFINHKKEQYKIYRKENREKLIAYDKKYNDEHKNEAKKYYEKNKEIIAEKSKLYREENKDKLKKYIEDHKDELKLKYKKYNDEHKNEAKEYYEKNKEIIAEKKKLYREANKDKLKKNKENKEENI